MLTAPTEPSKEPTRNSQPKRKQSSSKPVIDSLILSNRADGRTTYDQRMAIIEWESVLPRHFTIRVKNRKHTTLIHETHVVEVRIARDSD